MSKIKFVLSCLSMPGISGWLISAWCLTFLFWPENDWKDMQTFFPIFASPMCLCLFAFMNIGLEALEICKIQKQIIEEQDKELEKLRSQS